MLAIATCRPATRSRGSSLMASSSSSDGTTRERGSAPAVSCWRVKWRTASSPTLRTRWMISRALSATESPSGIKERMWADASVGPPRRWTSSESRRSRRISGGGRGGGCGGEALGSGTLRGGTRARARAQAGQQIVDGCGLQLVGDGVGDQTGCADHDLLPDQEVVLLEGGAGGSEVDDGLHHAGQGGELDGALDLHDLGLASRLLEVAGGDAGVLGGDPHHPQAPEGLGGGVGAGLAGEDHGAAAESQVEQLVDLPAPIEGSLGGLLEEDVLTGHPEVGGASLHIGGDVGGAHGDHPDVLEEKLAVVGAKLLCLKAEGLEKVDGVSEEGPTGDGDGEAVDGAHWESPLLVSATPASWVASWAPSG